MVARGSDADTARRELVDENGKSFHKAFVTVTFEDHGDAVSRIRDEVHP